MLIEELNLVVRSSIGIAIYPGDSQDIDELTKLADDAMYKAKAQKAKNTKERNGSAGQAVLASTGELMQFSLQGI
jgi:GGDEF domain-containing protein